MSIYNELGLLIDLSIENQKALHSIIESRSLI